MAYLSTALASLSALLHARPLARWLTAGAAALFVGDAVLGLVAPDHLRAWLAVAGFALSMACPSVLPGGMAAVTRALDEAEAAAGVAPAPERKTP